MVDFKIQTSSTSLFSKTILISNKNITCLLTLKWHIRTDDHSYTMLFEGGTPLNNPPIEIHANSSMFALTFWPPVTIFCIFWLHECLKWRLEFNSKSSFWYQSRQIFEVRAIEQRHHEFQLIHMPPHQFWQRYHSDGLSPVHVRFDFFSEQICNVEALICHFIKTSKLSRKFISLRTPKLLLDHLTLHYGMLDLSSWKFQFCMI